MKHTENFHRCENCGHIWRVEKSQISHNSDYAKCADEIVDKLYPQATSIIRKGIDDLLRKHFV